MTCSAIIFRGWVCGRLALGHDGDGRPVCAHHAPESWRSYLGQVADLAAYARPHRAIVPHVFPREECSTCGAVKARRRELAATCPA